MSRKNSLVINCNDLRRRVALRLLGITAPFWAVFAPPIFMGFLSSTSSSVGPWFLPFTVFSMILGPIGTLALWRNKLVCTDSSVAFPGLLGKRLPLKDLKRLFVESTNLCFEFEVLAACKKKNADQEGSATSNTFVRIALNRLNSNDRWRLIEFIEAKQSTCIVDEETRRSIAGDDFADSFEMKDKLRLSYESHSKLKAFSEILTNYEPLFWKVFAATCGFFFVTFSLPALICLPYFIFQRWVLGSTEYINIGFYQDWMRAAGPVLDGTKNVLTPMQSFYQWLEHNSSFAIFIMLAGAVMVLKCFWFLARPTEILISSVDLDFISTNLGVRFRHGGYFRWSECKKVQSKTGKDVGKIGEQTLVFEGASGELARIELSGLKRNSRIMLKKAIEKWAPHVQLDASFVETANAAKRETYTELWLRSLNTPPKRDRLTPLCHGDRLKGGDIVIEKMIGAGGQGVAYLADWRQPGQEAQIIVVKEFMLPVYVDRRARQQALERFEQEANLLSSLDHDRIVKLKDHFIEDHRAYLVLEFIDGKSLREAAKQGLRDESLLGDVVAQMCEILSHLHAQSPPMVHRDFAPDNLILNSDGTLKLIDFNVAHRVVNDSKATVVGKHAYMPPEQFAGRPCVQSDIYAMGATLYYLLCGEDPEPFSESGLPPGCVDVNPVWGEIIRGCTSLDLQSRFKSAEEILNLLRQSIEPQQPFEAENGESIKLDCREIVNG